MPPQIINQSQQMQAGIISPPALYTRRVNIQNQVANGLGAVNWAITPNIGQNAWLWSIDIWIMSTDPVNPIDLYIYLRKGSPKPLSHTQLINDWKPVLPMENADEQNIIYQGFGGSMQFGMSEMLQTDERAFGVVLVNQSALVAVEVLTSFRISEG